MEILRYKGYEATAELDLERGVCFGRVLFITDVVTFEAQSPKELLAEFEAAVDDYLETCAQLGREPRKPLSGSFNVRVSPESHRNARLRALRDGCSLNEIVCKALDCYLGLDSEYAKNYLTASIDEVVREASSRVISLHTTPIPEPYDSEFGRMRFFQHETIVPSNPYSEGRH